MKKDQIQRMNKINSLIGVIASVDRNFFSSKNGTCKFIELKTTVKFLDGYSQKKITVTDRRKDRNFSHGGTMWGLVKDFKEYILVGGNTNGENGYGGLYSTCWGYSIEGMDKIVSYGKEIKFLDKESLSYKDYLIRLYKANSMFLDSGLKERIEKELIA